MNAVQQLERLGQSIWYDNISRGILRSGELQGLVDQGVLGVTSNPTIFDKAISGSADYDDQIRQLIHSRPAISVDEIIQALMVKDIQMATDILRPVYDRTQRRDGYVSMEVTPGKARDTKATIEEVRLLWALINRPNLMIKIPATAEGLPAIEQAIREGMNINVTLIFSVDRYRQVAEAYIRGLEQRVHDGKPLDHVASVASVFVSRIDTLVDEMLQKNIAATADATQGARLRSYLGTAAVANTRIVYENFIQLFTGSRFESLTRKGATVQRPLWGSTGTKNPAYSDLLYVEKLVGPHTVNTVPPQTLAAILDHLHPETTIEKDGDRPDRIIRELEKVGVNMAWVMKKLENDGVATFEKSFDGLYKNLLDKRNAFAGTVLP